MSVSNPRFISRLNLCQEELMNEGDFPGVVDRWRFRVDQASGLVALPYEFDRMMEVTVDDVPQQMVSPWYEFVGYGPGVQDDFDARGRRVRCWTDWVVTDRGEAPTQKPVPDVNYGGLVGPWVIRVYASVVEASGAEINFQGLDDNGTIVRTLDVDWYTGERVAIDFSVPFTVSANNFSKITSVTKPETNGSVRITAWNGTDEVELSNFAYNETEPSYRHYYLPRMHNRGREGVRERVILARCRKRFVPVSADDDKLIISNINALKCMFIAQWKRDAGDYEAYAIQKQTAVDILKKEAMGYMGKARVPSITFQRGFPIGAVGFVR